MSDGVAQEIASLRDEIERHNRLYYVEAQPEITDREFDRLLNRLIDLEQQHPEFQSPDSPTQKVGGQPIEGFQTVPHAVPMLSIENVFEPEGIDEFDRRICKLLDRETLDYTIEYKIDGVALALVYEHGRLIRAVTRGDGQQGDDITSNARTARGVPLKLAGDNPPELLEVRGEAYIANSDFAVLRAEQEARGETVFANPRNSTAGALKLLDPKLSAQRKVRFVSHGIGAHSNFGVDTHFDYIEKLREFGLPTTPGIRVCHGIQEVREQIEMMMDDLHTLDLEVDGLVIKVNSLALREELGNTSKSPRWVIAYKWERYEATTRVEDIQIQVGKTGTLTPVAYLAPVEIAGTTVTRSSLHNRDELQRLDIRIGDYAVVEKAGKIIPHVLRVERERRDGSEQEFHFPTQCPECQTEVVQDEGGVYIRCPNPDCPARLRESLRFFASRQAMDIDGLGIKLIEQLVDAGLLTSLADIYRLPERRDEMLALDRMGEKSVDKVLKGIERSKEQPLWRLLTGLNIRHVGTSNARILAERFGSLGQLQEQSAENLAAVNEIGPVIAESVYEFLHSDFGATLVNQLADLGLNLGTAKQVSPEEEGAELPWAGKTFVLTGTLETFTRQQAEEEIRVRGGKASGSVSKKTSFVVAGAEAGSKLEKAEKLGISILTEADFTQMLEEVK
ncbi:NAD-dependent DNA ligase LigA [Rubinisphaera brasiliensis]|uniref:DNA ligase n=1 Tax=Rubinisphaera brasiliensis (strain ATCC 49424 / DSM 5305 / JCM 21570 / IAM 15109 / NBRC 103401 / IFAM 1448) TaxID=756272 RepID=F0SKJ2_RUBBR|nr:NAD-dependent DNA ligase LigA [Rubinisphaera brasiliensis]ADY61973.1 DNA ligase [Rubinisphaera brasiliensis DSM 5305]